LILNLIKFFETVNDACQKPTATGHNKKKGFFPAGIPFRN